MFIFWYWVICNIYFNIWSVLGFTDALYDLNDFYKVPFTEVVPLVRTRKVFLNCGYAYIPMGDLVVCIQSKFRASLSEALNVSILIGMIFISLKELQCSRKHI